MKSKAERLDDTLAEFAEAKFFKESIAAKKKIIDLFMECVPSELRTDFEIVTQYENGTMYTSKKKTLLEKYKAESWNACRAETLKNLEELRGA